MTTRRLSRLLMLAALLGLGSLAIAGTAPPHPFGSSISIHGRLAPLGQGVPTPDGLHEIRYLIFDAMTGGTELASTGTASVDVINGVFFDAPDFGTEVFSQEGSRFMEVGIRPAGSTDPFQRFQRVEVKPHPRAQFAGEIFLPAEKTVTIGSGSTALKINNDGTGGTAQFTNTNPGATDSTVQITSNATSTTTQALDVDGNTHVTGRFKAGLDDDFATFVVDEFGVLVDADLRVTGKTTFDGAVNFNQPTDFNDTTQMTSGKSISQVLATTIISNTNPTGRALLAFNQTGGEGVFGSSINGRGVVGDGTGSSSIALLGITNNGRAGVFQNSLTSSGNPTVQIANVGFGPSLLVQHNNPSATSPAISIATAIANAIGLQNNAESRFVGNVALGNFDPIHPLQHGSGAHLTSGGTFVSASSRALKEDFQPIDPRQVLDKVAQLPVATWKYRVEDEGVRHLGPTSEDFAAAFGLGQTDTGIGAVDADGVALCAIQGLHQLVREKDEQIALLSARLERLESMLQRLDQKSGDQ